MTRVLFATLACLVLAMPAAGKARDNPDELVLQLCERIFHRLDENRERYEQDSELLFEMIREEFLPHLDRMYSARLILGRHGRSLEHEQIEEFAEALSDMLLRRFGDGFLHFKDPDQIRVLPLAGDNTDRVTRVRSRINLGGGRIAPVDYVFRKTDGQWKVFDVIFEGISYVATFRNQIGEEIRRFGFDGLMDRIRAGEIEVPVNDQ